MTKEELRHWKEGPVTSAFFKMLQDKRDVFHTHIVTMPVQSDSIHQFNRFQAAYQFLSSILKDDDLLEELSKFVDPAEELENE